MDKKKTGMLLQKFYEGETSLGEERMLEDLLLRPDIPSSLKPDRDIFAYFKKKREEDRSAPYREKRILRAIAEEDSTFRNTTRRMIYRITSVAASLLILALTWFLLFSPRNSLRTGSVDQDTFENPHLAYLETKKTLIYLSEKMNEGTRGLENLANFEKGTRELKNLNLMDKGTSGIYTFSLFNTGVSEMQQITIFSRTQEKITRK